jgi:hypothetical protein
VILEHRPFPPNATVPRGSRIEYLSKTTDIIAVGRVEAITPQLVWLDDDFTNRIADESTANWIRSVIQLQVERVIKDRLNAIPFLLSFARDGGSAVVGTTRVDFVIAGSRPVVEQRRYLVWGNMKDGAFARTAIYEITSAGRLASLTASTAKDELQILSLDEAVAAIDVALGR